MNIHHFSARRCLSLIVALAVVFSCFIISTADVSAASVSASAYFVCDNVRLTELTPGRIMASVYIFSSSDEKVIISLGYYDSDGTLLDFSPKVIDASVPGLKNLFITVPSTVTDSQYIKLIGMTAESMQPISISNSTLVYRDPYILGVETAYTGLSERYYTLDSPNGSINVESTAAAVAESGTPLRLKDMAEGEYAFESALSPRYRLTYNGTSVSRSLYRSGSSTQRWKLEEYGSGYAVAHSDGGYLAIENGEIVVRDEKYEWSLTLYGETPFTLMTSLDGFKLLTAAQQQRVIEICTSIGADVFPSAVTTGSSWLDSREASFKDLYYSRSTTTAEEQRDKILEIVSQPLFGSLVDYYTISETFPGCATSITQSAPVKTKHIMWDLVEVNGEYFSDDGVNYIYDANNPINCYVITVTYKNATSSQTVKVYCVDPDFENVQNTITAFGNFPYNYRKYIKNIYVYAPTNANSYNCGAEELYVRLSGVTSVQGIMKGIAHELGHSVDYNANGNPNNSETHWCQGSAWQGYVAADIATISTYGSSNYYEGLAEFSRVYFICYGDRDLQLAIQQLYPNRYGSFERMLTKIGGIGMY